MRADRLGEPGIPVALDVQAMRSVISKPVSFRKVWIRLTSSRAMPS
jgi:hypothetical protein